MNRTAIVSAKRTPFGSFLGSLQHLSAPDLGALALSAVNPQHLNVDEVYMGCVVQGGVGQGPARQAAIKAHLSSAIPATAINKVCGSGMKSIMLAHDQILLGNAQTVLAGGMESLSQAPFSLMGHRVGYRLGNDSLLDLLMHDGLEDAYSKDKKLLMGALADKTAEVFRISRDDQENYVKDSYDAFMRSLDFLQSEIIPIEVASKILVSDEPASKVKPEKFSLLKSAFSSEGTITAATSSSLADGAAAVCLMSEEGLKVSNEKPLAWILGHASHAQEPKDFASAPIGAVEKLLKKLQWTIDDVDIFEINEAFAVVPLVTMKSLNIPREKVNPHGGACILGHPLGATGARLVVTLAHSLRAMGKKRGIATACIGGGEATAIALESV